MLSATLANAANKRGVGQHKKGRGLYDDEREEKIKRIRTSGIYASRNRDRSDYDDSSFDSSSGESEVTYRRRSYSGSRSKSKRRNIGRKRSHSRRKRSHSRRKRSHSGRKRSHSGRKRRGRSESSSSSSSMNSYYGNKKSDKTDGSYTMFSPVKGGIHSQQSVCSMPVSDDEK